MQARIVLLCELGRCGSRQPAVAEPERGVDQVVAAFYPLAFAAEQIAGDRASGLDLTPPGAEPHDLELTAARRGARSTGASLVLYLGDGFQPGLERGRGGPGGAEPRLLRDPTTSRSEEARRTRTSGSTRSGTPPSPGGSERRSATPAAADALVRRLQLLDARFRDGLERLRPPRAHHEPRGVRVSRGTLRARAGPAGRAVPGGRARPEGARAARRRGARRRARRRSSRRPLGSTALADTVARESGAKTATLDPLEGLTAAEVAAGADYFCVMQENLAALRKALGCT